MVKTHGACPPRDPRFSRKGSFQIPHVNKDPRHTPDGPPRSSSVAEDVLTMFDNDIAPAQIADALRIPIASVNAIILRSDREAVRQERLASQIPDPVHGAEETRRAVENAYRNKVPVGTVCEEYGITRDEYWIIVAESGEPVRSWERTREMARSRRDSEVIAMYEAGVRIEVLANQLSIGKRTIYDILERHNVKPSRREADDKLYRGHLNENYISMMKDEDFTLPKGRDRPERPPAAVLSSLNAKHPKSNGGNPDA